MKRALAFVALLACTTSQASFPELAAPAYGEFRSWALCGDSMAVDAQASWTEGGCENGAPKMRRVRDVGEPERRAIAAAFAAFPASAKASGCEGNRVAHFEARDASGHRTWDVCATEKLDVPSPFSEAQALLRKATDQP